MTPEALRFHQEPPAVSWGAIARSVFSAGDQAPTWQDVTLAWAAFLEMAAGGYEIEAAFYESRPTVPCYAQMAADQRTIAALRRADAEKLRRWAGQ